jgi:hypothetical protein
LVRNTWRRVTSVDRVPDLGEELTMRDEVEALLSAVSADLTASGLGDAVVHRSQERLKALQVDTEDEQQTWMQGYCRLTQMFYVHATEGAASTAFLASYEQATAAFNRLYGSDDTPYRTANRIVARAAERLRAGEDIDTLVVAEKAALDPLMVEPEVYQWAYMRIQAMAMARRWLAEPPLAESADAMLVMIDQLLTKIVN